MHWKSIIEDNSDEQRMINSWKKTRAAECYKSIAGMTVVAILLVVLAVTMDELGIEQYAFLITAILVIVWLCMSSAKQIRYYKQIEIKDFIYTHVLRKERFSRATRIQRYKYRTYYLIIMVAGIEVEAKCDMDTYMKTEVGKIVFAFQNANGEIYATFLK